MDSVDVRTMGPNQSPLTEIDLEAYKGQEGAARKWPKSPFPIDEDINNRIVLYDGDIELLRAEAIVNPTNENLTQLGFAGRMAGSELEYYIRKKVRLCATGDVRLTPGFKSNFRYIIHAVPPKYQPKYKTAAETALFHTYFRILEAMIEKKIRTVIMPTLTTSKCNLPVKDNCLLQLRIIRRILEKKLREFDKIVLHVQDVDTYTIPFFCYFPRTTIDEEIACYFFTGSLGGANGEPVIPEREIRIKSKPAFLGDNDNSIDLTSGLDLSTVVGKTAFSKMQDDVDQPSNARMASRASSGSLKVVDRKNKQSNEIALGKSVFQGCNLL